MAERIIAALDLSYEQHPGQRTNLDALKAYVNSGKPLPVPSQVLYALNGKVHLTSDTEFYNMLDHGDVTLFPDVHVKTNKPLVFYYFGVEFMFPVELRGDRSVTRKALTVNDTGSNLQNIHRSDWDALNVFGHGLHLIDIVTAAKREVVETVLLTIRIIKRITQDADNQMAAEQWLPLTPWFTENVRVVKDDRILLSGAKIRDHLFFATAPGNDRLLISQRKQAIIDALPASHP
ncbi:hypothetical protein VPNG_03744 [Cytospora leucostoma]|uniref:Uncharacterized protein n=1 Tax=Cytospora leucostoma TaxID=1230097 RepID=A0A423XF81_9PEZI|nr:hypothetical protein VPNG_03744 [Cytospora leucostoma]